jgi:integrase
LNKQYLYGPAYENFINTLKSPKTKEDYIRYLLEFLSFLGIQSLDDILIEPDPKFQKNRITKFLTYLKNEKKVLFSYRRTALSAIKHFFVVNDFLLNWELIAKFLGEHDIAKKTRAYTRKEIRRLLEVGDSTGRDRAMILLLCSSAVRIGSLHSMKVGDITKTENYDIFRIITYRDTTEEYYTFCTSE